MQALREAGVEVCVRPQRAAGRGRLGYLDPQADQGVCAFIPVISHNAHDRDEGYFRLEWKLAVDRSHLMAAGRPFLLPVVIDETRDDDEQVPERFRELQWTRLLGGVASAAFVERVRRLLSGEQEPSKNASPAVRGTTAASGKAALPWWRSKAVLFGAIAVVIVALGYLAANRFGSSTHPAEVVAVVPSPSAPAGAAEFNPPPH